MVPDMLPHSVLWSQVCIMIYFLIITSARLIFLLAKRVANDNEQGSGIVLLPNALDVNVH